MAEFLLFSASWNIYSIKSSNSSFFRLRIRFALLVYLFKQFPPSRPLLFDDFRHFGHFGFIILIFEILFWVCEFISGRITKQSYSTNSLESLLSKEFLIFVFRFISPWFRTIVFTISCVFDFRFIKFQFRIHLLPPKPIQFQNPLYFWIPSPI